MSGAGGSERLEEQPEERQRVVPPASPRPCVSGRSPSPADTRGAPHLRGPSPPLPLIAPFLPLQPYKIIWGVQTPPKGPEPPSHGAQGLFPGGNPWYSGSVGVWGLPRGVTLCCLCPPQILALGQEGVLQELVLGVGQPPEPGELFLLPLDQSQCFLVGKSPGGLGRTSGIK